MAKKKNKIESSREDIRELVEECILTHNELILVELIYRLEKEYVEVSELSTLGEYKASWSHHDVLNYITYNM
tara:strand:- start:422 stop:637 length:216 start_codon:yes stop_codon:yes gene_type:complete